MGRKSPFGKKAVILQPATEIKKIEAAVRMRLKPIFADIYEDIIAGIKPYYNTAEAVRRVKEADYSRPDINKIVSEYENDIEVVLMPAVERAGRITSQAVATAFGSEYNASFFRQTILPTLKDRVFKIVTTEITPSLESSLKAKFATAIEEGWSLDKLVNNLGELKGNHATIARTEILSASSQAERLQTNSELIELNAVDRAVKEWHTSGSGKERDSHLEAGMKYGPGNGIPYTEEFELSTDNGGVEYAAEPRDPKLSAGNFINCQCRVALRIQPIGA